LYGIKHEAQRAQLWDYAHRKALTFLWDNMGKTNPTQKEITPIYVGWLDKAAKLYWQKKDKQESSAHTSTSTISDFLSSAGEQPTPTAKDYPPPTDVKRVPPPTPRVGNTNNSRPR
jgi:hypothetical protein